MLVISFGKLLNIDIRKMSVAESVAEIRGGGNIQIGCGGNIKNIIIMKINI